MTHSKRSKYYIALVLAISFALSSAIPPAHSTASQAKVMKPGLAVGNNRAMAKPSRPLPQPQHVDMPHTLAATYYNLNDGLSAALMLSNQGPQPLAIHVALFSLTGTRFDAPPLTLNGNEARAFDLHDWAMAGGAEFRQGSLQVSYNGTDMGLGGVVRLIDSARSLSFDEELAEPVMMFASARLEGVWWLPSRKAEMRLALSNTTDAPLTARLLIDGIAPKETEPEALSFRPHETRLLDSKDFTDKHDGVLSEIGGISVTYSGRPGALLAHALIQEPAAGYSSVVEFSDPQAAQSSRLDGAGLRLGTAGNETLTQVAVARNVGATPTILTGRVTYTTTDGRAGVVALPDTRLAAGEAKAIRLAAALNERGLRNVAAAGLEFNYSSVPGSVIMSAQSVSRSGNQVFRVPMIDAVSQANGTGRYPWSIEAGASSLVYIKNVTSHAQSYVMYVLFDGGIYTVGQRVVAAGQTITLDVRALRDSQVPDANGQRIPLAATHGRVDWSAQGADRPALMGRIEQTDVAHGLSMTSSCGTCCRDSFYDGWVSPDHVTGFPGDTTQFTAWQRNIATCSSYIYPPFNPTATWSSLAPTVASCDGGQATAINPGAATIRAEWEATDFSTCEAQPIDVLADALCDVRPPAVMFQKITWSTKSADFDFPSNSATLDLSGDRLTSAACGGQQFAINVTFRQPDNSAGCCHSPIDNFVKAIDGSQYVVVSSDFYENDTTSGEVSVTLKRTGEGTRNVISINVGGTYQSGDSWPGVGIVHLQCPQ